MRLSQPVASLQISQRQNIARYLQNTANIACKYLQIPLIK